MSQTKMILTGHGSFSVGLHDALECIAGEQTDLKIVEFDTTRSEQEYLINLRNALSSFETDDTVVVFADLVGGTPYKMAVQLKLEGSNVRVIGGTNLGMLIDFALSRTGESDVDALITQCLQSGKDSIAEFFLDEDCDEEEEE